MANRKLLKRKLVDVENHIRGASRAYGLHGIKVLMAKNYIDNLSEEARKGQQEKAEQGIWPTKAPLGYLNVPGEDGKRIIAPDPAVASIIAKIFEMARLTSGGGSSNGANFTDHSGWLGN